MRQLRSVATIILLLVGGFFIFCGVVTRQAGLSRYQGMIPVECKVLSMTNGTLLEYQVNGQTYQGYANKDATTLRVGKTYCLMVDPQYPSRIFGPVINRLPTVLFILGVLLLIGAAVVYECVSREIRALEELVMKGLHRTGKVISITKNRRIAQHGRRPWEVEAECVHPLTGETISVLDTTVWRLTMQVGDPIAVIFHPTNEKVYVLDVGEDIV